MTVAAVPRLRIREVRGRVVDVPIRRPLVTSAGTVGTATLLLVDLLTEEGVAGCAYVFSPRSSGTHAAAVILADAAQIVAGEDAAPAAIDALLERQFRLVGNGDIVFLARSAIDCACWDALARAAQMPLYRLLGGAARPIPAYNSNGLGLIDDPARAAAEAQELVAEGFDAIKIRLGRREAADDLRAVRAVRAAIGDGVRLMSDYNQGLVLHDALARCRALDDEGLAWIEEPIAHDDYAGCATLANALRTPVQIGENFVGAREMSAAIAAGASDYVMPDLGRIGGVSGFLRANALAESAALPISAHLFPEYSAHVLAVAPTAHYLEYMDWANPVLAQPVRIRDGMLHLSGEPGSGVAWDEDAVARYRVDR